MVERVIVAKPRGFCAGVVRAVDIVERALGKFGTPLYVRREIVHNRRVVDGFIARGVTFVSELADVPDGGRVIFSAHGVSPQVRAEAAARGLVVIDATCPLVTKVHLEAKAMAARGYTILLVGHRGHDEIVGTSGESPDSTILIETVAQARSVRVPDEGKVACLTQTTLSMDDTAAIIAALRERFPRMQTPPRQDICYATQNRQNAAKELAKRTELILVIGAQNSSNSNRLAETARAAGVEAHLIADAAAIDARWLSGKKSVGVTSGASVPEELVQDVVEKLSAGGARVEALETLKENVFFPLPAELRT